MPVMIGAKAPSGFDQPLGLMTDCHRRIEQFLRVLIDIVQDCPDGQLNAAQRRSLQTALDYFQHAAPHHTADEELSLFPRLRALDSRQARQALWKLDSLEVDHVYTQQAHARIDAIGRRWLAEGHLDAPARAEWANRLSGLAGAYQRHIAVEDEQLFPLARRLLSRRALFEIGREMATRRGLAEAVWASQAD